MFCSVQKTVGMIVFSVCLYKGFPSVEITYEEAIFMEVLIHANCCFSLFYHLQVVQC